MTPSPRRTGRLNIKVLLLFDIMAILGVCPQPLKSRMIVAAEALCPPPIRAACLTDSVEIR